MNTWLISAKHEEWFKGYAKRNKLEIVATMPENNKLRITVKKS